MKTQYGFNIFWSEDDGGYIATCPDFPGFMAFGDTYEDAAREAKGVVEMFIESYNERGKPLPDATVLNGYSGQIRLRMPNSLHRDLAATAEKEGVSLNVYMVSLLASRHAVKDFAIEIIEQVKRVQKQIVTEFIKGSEVNRRAFTNISYTSTSGLARAYNVNKPH